MVFVGTICIYLRNKEGSYLSHLATEARHTCSKCILQKKYFFLSLCITVVGIMTRLHLERSRVQVQAGTETFLFSEHPEWPWYPPSLCSVGTRDSALGLKQAACEADHSPTSSAKVRNEWSYTTTTLYAFMTCAGTTLPLPITFFIFGSLYKALLNDWSWMGERNG